MTETEQRAASVDSFLRPRSVAVVGFSMKSGSAGTMCLEGLTANKFAGPIHLVGRTPGEYAGRLILGNIDELPLAVDLAVLCVPAAAVREAVAGCIRRKVKAGVIFASGFAELGPEARNEQEQIAGMARQAGLWLIGPNCLGYTNYVQPLQIGFMPAAPIKPVVVPKGGAAAIITQSGGLMAHFHQALASRNVPVAYRISTGNEVGTEIGDFLHRLAEDPAPGVIVVYAEHIRSPQSFLEGVAKARAAGKAVVVLHAGRGERAQQATASHTGAMAGDYTVMAAKVTAAGAILADSMEEVVDLAELLVRFPRLPEKGVAVLTTSGAFCALANDHCEQLGLEIPAFSGDVLAALKARMPDFVELTNPFDLTTQVVFDSDLIGDCAKLALADPRIGSVCLVIPYGNPERALYALRQLAQATAGQDKPVILTILGEQWPLTAEYLQLVRETGMVLSRSSERSLRTLAKVTACGRLLAAEERTATAQAAARLPSHASGTLAEWEGKRLLAAMGIPVPEGALAKSAEEALATARRVGFPVAVKLQSRQLTHKTEIGGVILNVADEQQLRQAWDTLLQRAEKAGAGATIDGVLVERMSPKGVEMMVGAKRDPLWGPVVMVGLGGVWVEVLKDVRVFTAGLGQRRILDEIASLRSARLLEAFRGAPPRDREAVANVAAAIGRLMLDHPEIREIDINPLMVLSEGEGAIALDALVVVSDKEAA